MPITQVSGKRSVAGVVGQTPALTSRDPCTNTSLNCCGSIDGVDTEMLIDTGSVYTLVNYDLFKQITNKRKENILLSKFEKNLVSANGEK